MQNILNSWVIRVHWPALLIATVALVVAGLYSGDRTLLDLSILTAIFSVMAVSLGMIFGQAGLMSLGQAAFAALGAYTTAILTTRWEISPLISLFASIAVPVIIAYPFARLTVRMSHLALALATLFLGEILLVLLSQGGEFTGGFVGLGGIPMLGFATDPVVFHLLAWSFVIIAVFCYSNIMASASGRALNTLRNDALRSQADGDRGASRLSMLFAFSAGLCGAAGWLYAHYLTYLAPESLPPLLSISLLLMVIVGGSRYVLGPVVGAAVLTLLNDRLPDDVQGLLYGTSLVLVLLIAPSGLLGLAESAWNRVRGHSPETSNDSDDGELAVSAKSEEVVTR